MDSREGFDIDQDTSDRSTMSEESNHEIKTLKDVRRYDKKTLPCPGGCCAQLQLHEIASHECLSYLKDSNQQMEEHIETLEAQLSDMNNKETMYKNNIADLESKIEDMAEEMKLLVSERARRDEVFGSKETFYKEQTSALKDQVLKLESRIQETRSKRPALEDEFADIHRVEKEWAFRYDKLLAEKISIETIYQRKEREYQNEMYAMQQEVYALRDSLRLEREVMALEYDQTNCEKLQNLIDQLEEVVRQKKDTNSPGQEKKQLFSGCIKEDFDEHSRLPHLVSEDYLILDSQ